MNLVLMCLIFHYGLCSESAIKNFQNMREAIIKNEENRMLGSRVTLTHKEKQVNDIIMRLKASELFHIKNGRNSSKYYLDFKDEIPKSTLYQIIRKMPKGGGLHYHNTAILRAEYLLNLTYHDDLYGCFTDDNEPVQLLFSASLPTKPCTGKWKAVSEERKKHESVTAFDEMLKTRISLTNRNSMNQQLSASVVWENFERVHNLLSGLLSYRPVWEEYFEASLKAFYEDGIIYVELRGSLRKLYELNGTVYDPSKMLEVNNKVTAKFRKEHNDFVGVKYIYAKWRFFNSTGLNKILRDYKMFKNKSPEDIIGFDLVGREETGARLKDYAEILVNADVPFYFHAGETNSYGSVDENLIDAIALGAKRLGHAFSLIKHPGAMKVVKELSIGLEVNVISNQVLGFLKDFRLHPLAHFLAAGMPVILSGDDPGSWDAPPISYDFYITFVAIASEKADLRMLKQLALNSIELSSLSETEKKAVMTTFNKMWTEFINDVLNNCDEYS